MCSFVNQDPDNIALCASFKKSVPVPHVDRFYIKLINVCNFGCDFCVCAVSKSRAQCMDFFLF
jgi:hypothetical protein